jgi:hypothetical protein
LEIPKDDGEQIVEIVSDVLADFIRYVRFGFRIEILPTGLSPCRASISNVHGRPVQYGLVSGAVCVGHSRTY